MLSLKKRIRNEKGSMTLEFLVVFPLYLMLFLILWQAVAFGITIMQAQSAVNEGAKIYSLTGIESDARLAVQNAIGTSDIMEYEGFTINLLGGSEFSAEVKLTHGLVFVPKEWRNRASIPFELTATSRVIK